MTKQNIIIIFSLIFFSCETSSIKSNIKGEYYTVDSFNKYEFCPLFITINDTHLSVLYSNNIEVKKFKISNISSTEKFTLDLGDSNLDIKLLKKNYGLQMINKSKSFIFGGKDTLELLQSNKITLDSISKRINGYWYSEDFFPSLNNPKAWIKITKDSITVSVTLENSSNPVIHKKNELKITNFKTVSFFGINQVNDDRILFVDKIDNNNMQLLLKECNNYKSFIHLKKINFLEYKKKKIKQEEFDRLD